MLNTKLVEFGPPDKVDPGVSKNEVSLGHAKQNAQAGVHNGDHVVDCPFKGMANTNYICRSIVHFFLT